MMLYKNSQLDTLVSGEIICEKCYVPNLIEKENP
jgi:hypothetical protein